MATKRVCDRCGAEINPFNSVTYAGMRRIKNDINGNDSELCVSCAHELRKWFNMEKAPVTVVSPAVHGVHGRWVHHDDGVVTCSECGNAESSDSYYCRYCGAKMDGGDSDDSDEAD